MLTKLSNHLRTWIQALFPAGKTANGYPESVRSNLQIDYANGVQFTIAYDKSLLERSRTQWQFGDWKSLIDISHATLEHHPDRAELALLVATGHSACGNVVAARNNVQLAIDWGCSKKLISQIFISGVHNALGRACAVNGNMHSAKQHFQKSIQTTVNHNDVHLLTQARMSHQLEQLHLLNRASGGYFHESHDAVRQDSHSANKSEDIASITENTPLRILFIANAVIPTLQLSFLKPLKSMYASNMLKYEVATESIFNNKEWKGNRSAHFAEWLHKMAVELKPNLMVFCRYSGAFSEDLLSYAKESNIPSIYHIDDDLLNVPLDIGFDKYKFHNKSERLSSVKFLLNNVDLVYCSTKVLHDLFVTLNVSAPIFQGDIYCAAEIVSTTRLKPVEKVGYMGIGHQRDLETVVPALVRYLRENRSVKFEIFGTIPLPDELREFEERITVMPKIESYDEFLQQLADLRWDIGICPLVPNHFNAMKSNTKWVEYTATGTAVIASRNMIYEDCCAEGCGLLAQSVDEWYAALQQLTAHPEARHTQVQRAQKKLMRHYSTEQLRQQVLHVFSLATHLHNKSSVLQ